MGLHTRLPDGVEDMRYKVVGGVDVIPHEFPYQVNIQYHTTTHHTLLCGGAIINTLIILTAAHCFKDNKGWTRNLSRLRVVAGDHDQYYKERVEQIRNVSHFFIHEDYNYITDANDIAILVLSEPLLFNSFVSNISYPRKPTEFRGHATITGWGKLAEGRTSPNSDILQKATVPIVSKTECRRAYSQLNMTVTESMICAGSDNSDACLGDSGGPLTCTVVGSKDQVLCGIVSFGYGCARSGYPGVYSDVSHFSQWIDTTTHFYQTMKGKCKKSSFYCQEDHKCISRSLVCNGIKDCSQGSEELNCQVTSQLATPATNFRCSNGISIPLNRVCNGYNTCGDNSDEDKCQRSPCLNNQFTCKKDGRCVEKSWTCDEVVDCEDASDENCDDGHYFHTSPIKLPIPIPAHPTTYRPKPGVSCPPGVDFFDLLFLDYACIRNTSSTTTAALKYIPLQESSSDFHGTEIF